MVLILPYLNAEQFSFANLHERMILTYGAKTSEELRDIKEVIRESQGDLLQEVSKLNERLAESDERLAEADTELKKTYSIIEKFVHQVKFTEDGYNNAIDILFRLRSLHAHYSSIALFKNDSDLEFAQRE